jgi:hypothetical protein
MRRVAVLVLALPVWLSACASANKRYEQGQRAEREGRPADAAARYVQALKKDGSLESARTGLRDAGARAVADYVAQAAAEDAAGRPDRAADAFLAADDLRGDARAVGVELAGPDDYAARRRAALDRAIAAALGDAQTLAAGGRYDDAARQAERAAERWLPNGTQRASLAGARAGAHLAGARADTARGRFRAAYERAARAADFEGIATSDAEQARALQAAALARGAVRVAVVPVWATEAARRALPDDALPALADELLDKPWTEPPLFVALTPVPDVQRELRRLDLARRALSAAEAARLGRALEADYVIVAEVDSVHGAESNLKSTRRAVKTTNGADTAFTVEEGRRRVYARITYDLVDPETRRAVERQTVSATTSGDFKRARYAGDPRTLDLRRADRELFDRAAQERDLARELAEDLSLQYARDLFDTLLRRIP